VDDMKQQMKDCLMEL